MKVESDLLLQHDGKGNWYWCHWVRWTGERVVVAAAAAAATATAAAGVDRTWWWDLPTATAAAFAFAAAAAAAAAPVDVMEMGGRIPLPFNVKIKEDGRVILPRREWW